MKPGGEIGSYGPDPDAENARADWERRIYRRLTDTQVRRPVARVAGAAAACGRPREPVTSGWTGMRSTGAAGYLIERTGPDGDVQLLQHGGSDVPAVPSSPFGDTGLTDGGKYQYRIAAVVGAEYPAWNWSEPVTATLRDAAAAPVEIVVDAAEPGRDLAAGLAHGRVGAADPAAIRRRRQRQRHRRRVRRGAAHRQGRPGRHSGPRARDPARRQPRRHAERPTARSRSTSPSSTPFMTSCSRSASVRSSSCRSCRPRSPAIPTRRCSATAASSRRRPTGPSGAQVVHALAAHLVDRYGIDEVANWAFEVWNEPNLEVFWTGSKHDYLRLYDEAARGDQGRRRAAARRRSVDRGRRMDRRPGRPRRAGRRAAGLRHQPHLRQPAARRRARRCDRHGFDGPSDLVDGVGRRVDPLRRDPRQRRRARRSR